MAYHNEISAFSFSALTHLSICFDGHPEFSSSRSFFSFHTRCLVVETSHSSSDGNRIYTTPSSYSLECQAVSGCCFYRRQIKPNEFINKIKLKFLCKLWIHQTCNFAISRLIAMHIINFKSRMYVQINPPQQRWWVNYCCKAFYLNRIMHVTI